MKNEKIVIFIACHILSSHIAAYCSTVSVLYIYCIKIIRSQRCHSVAGYFGFQFVNV